MSSRHDAPRPRDGSDPAVQLVQASSRALGWLVALVVGLPVILVGLAELTASDRGGPFAVIGVTAFCVLLCLALAQLMRRHRLRLDGDGLEVATTFYRRHFALADLGLEQARVVDLDERPEYRPMLRTNGMALPGFRSGWYRQRSGDRALVAAAGGRRLLWIPTRAGHDLLLEPANPQALLERLRAMAAGQATR